MGGRRDPCLRRSVGPALGSASGYKRSAGRANPLAVKSPGGAVRRTVVVESDAPPGGARSVPAPPSHTAELKIAVAARDDDGQGPLPKVIAAPRRKDDQAPGADGSADRAHTTSRCPWLGLDVGHGNHDGTIVQVKLNRHVALAQILYGLVDPVAAAPIGDPQTVGGLRCEIGGASRLEAEVLFRTRDDPRRKARELDGGRDVRIAGRRP